MRHHTTTGLYRSRRGLLFGVCRGLADYFDFSAFWMRVLCVAAFIVTGFFPVVVAYLIAALVMRLEPAGSLAFDSTYGDCGGAERPATLQRIRSSFESLDRRIQRIESAVTAREYSWDERLRNG